MQDAQDAEPRNPLLAQSCRAFGTLVLGRSRSLRPGDDVVGRQRGELMAGYRNDDFGGAIGHGVVRTDVPAHRLEAGPCLAIMTVAEDFQDLIRAECPRCRLGTGDCLVGLLRKAAADSAAN